MRWWAAALPLGMLVALGTAAAYQNDSAQTETSAPIDASAQADVPEKRARTRSAAPARTREATPMAERVAVIGLLNKRNGLARDLTLKPGQAVRVGDVIVRLRACERTASWEPEQLTGAFVQLDVRGRDGRWRRPFSGWLYKETPSLNVVEHPVYDVWPKSCVMRSPDIGADTLVAPSGGSSRSSAKKSAAPAAASPAPAAAANPSAESSNPT
ncbi:hypothetical protein SAMN05192580_1473 [Sphingomonas jatrophae]|uniref:DUF2155 domain-containing protein n=1 Tax=Sphingomonas jatrophae TaxID=1166337 RepID=A0A1I6KAD2_9SPHN|nr:hypothetical protein SAMN05192580_1473 [Sphingomonas jatrophae]